MKKALLFTITLVCMIFSYAQEHANLIIFTPQGERFQLVINGLLQNETPKTNVKVEGLNAPQVVAKVLFEDATIPALDIPAIYLTMGTEATYEVRKNTKGTKYVLRPVSSVPIPGGSSAVVVAPNPTPTPAPTTNPKNNTNGVGINVNLGGASLDVSINENGTNSNNQADWNNGTQTNMNLPVGCNGAMASNQFSGIKTAVQKQSFNEQKMTILKQALNTNGCISVAQVKELIGLFTFEDDKLEVAKFCYSKCYDFNSYYQVNDAFSFDSSIDALNAYIASQPKPQVATNYPANFNNGNGTVNQVPTPRPAPVPQPRPNPNPKPNPAPKPTPSGCFAMNEGDFQSALASIKKQSFNDTKMQVAKQITSSNCLTCSQIKEVMKLFSFESSKLDYAKYAYDFAYDKGNYYQINDAFSFSSSVDELTKYISGKK